METPSKEDLHEITQLVELTSDAVLICRSDGSIDHVNHRMAELAGADRAQLIGADIKDLLFSEAFERAEGHRLPFPVDGTPVTLMLKLFDGSFIPVEARASGLSRRTIEVRKKFFGRLHIRERVLVVVRSLEEEYARNRQVRRALSELQAANKRLSGTLSVIMSTVGAESLPQLLHAVLNRLVDALDADGTTLYFTENGGFKLRGVSETLEHTYVPEFIPYGAGVPTYVMFEARSCRLSIVPADEGAGGDAALYDLDKRVNKPLWMQDTPPFKTLIAVPVLFGQQVVGVLELGWRRHILPRTYDVNVLEVVCDFLSIQLVSLAESLRSQREAELVQSLNHVRDTLYGFEDDRNLAWGEVASEIKRALSCYLCPVVFDEGRGCYVIDFEGGSAVSLPGDIEQMFFSTTAPAAHLGSSVMDFLSQRDHVSEVGERDLRYARLTRIDPLSWVAEWLDAHGLPNQGVFIDMDEELLDAAVPPAASDIAALAPASPPAPTRKMLLLRDGTQEPIDDIEFDYLVQLLHTFEQFLQSALHSHEDRHIAQALQAGMRSSIDSIPGITADALYSSATRQAEVGGDFYTLIQLPDHQAVMILGDVSGKGVEAASMSAFVKTALSAYAWESMSPVHMVRSLNGMMMNFSRIETFATMFVARIDLAHRHATYCSAGHPPTMLVRRAALGSGEDAQTTREVELLSVQSGVVGAFEGMAYEQGTFRFDAGDVLFMYTDGAIEARNPAGDFFGERRLRDILLSGVEAGVDGLCQRVLDELDAFTASSLEDDVALVALRFD